MSSLLNIGMSGLTASHVGLTVVGNNLANVDTAGYSRQQVIQTTGASQAYGSAGYIGSGTTLADIRRVYNAYLDAQLHTATSLNADAATYLDQITPTDQLLSNSDTGISTALQSFFKSMQDLAAAPNTDANRQAVITNSQTIASRFNALATQLDQQNTNINSQMGDIAAQVNKLASNIANLNQQITAASVNGSPNDLLDARNESVRQLSALVGVNVTERNGNYDVTFGNGQPLVVGNTANTLSVAVDRNDPSKTSIILQRGQISSDVTNMITGGSLGGLVRYRNEVLTPAQNELGRVAMVIADQVNNQLAQGLDKNGDFGSALFSDINSATAVAQRSIARIGNDASSGNFAVTIADSSKLTTSDYQVTFVDDTHYTVKRLSDNTMIGGTYDATAATGPTIDGFTLKLNGSSKTGDSFQITPTRNGAANFSTVLADASKLAAAAPLTGTKSSSASGTGAISDVTLAGQVSVTDGAARSALQDRLESLTPMRVVMGDVTSGTQGYTIYDSQGNTLGTGTIVPGQENKVSLPLTDAGGNPILGGDGQPMSVRFTLSGSSKSGDSYEIAMTQAGSTDNRNAQAIIDLQTKATVGATGSSKGYSFTDAYAKLVSNVGAQAKQGTMDSTATTAILKSASDARDSVSGVDMDEENMNLIKYQQYYTASSQIIKTAQEIFSTLINSL